MTSKTALLLILLVSHILCSCETAVSLAIRDRRSWESIQSMGGISLGAPSRDAAGNVSVPVNCDVSGLHKVTVQPTGIDSGAVCLPPRVSVKQGTIYVTVITTIASDRHPSPYCPPLALGRIAPGTYAAVYLSPDGSQQPLGHLTIP